MTLGCVYYRSIGDCLSFEHRRFVPFSVPGEISTAGSLCSAPRHATSRARAGDGNGIVDALDDTEGEFGHPRSRARNEK